MTLKVRALQPSSNRVLPAHQIGSVAIPVVEVEHLGVQRFIGFDGSGRSE